MSSTWKRMWHLPLALVTLSIGATGCASLTPISGFPASRLPQALRGDLRANKVTIDLARLRQDPPPVYQLGPRDILGIYIEGVLGDRESPPPVKFPEDGNIPPAIGYPIPVREDGTLSLPLVEPITVEGLTLAQAEDAIREAYTVKKEIIRKDQARIIVTLMRPRTYQVLVIRQESGLVPQPQIARGVQVSAGPNAKQGNGYSLDLRAYENDVLHALTATGGLPGLDTKNEIKIIRGAFKDATERDRLMQEVLISKNPCCPPVLSQLDDPNVIKIPIRYSPGEEPVFEQDDIILRTGDIVLIESRDADRFYTGGLLGGGEYPLPRDYDLDVLGAIAVAGGPIASGTGRSGGLFGGGNGLGALIPPTECIVIRKLPGGGQVPLKLNLRKAILNPQERVIIQPGDLILVQYTTAELIGNIFLSTVSFNFLFQNLFNN